MTLSLRNKITCLLNNFGRAQDVQRSLVISFSNSIIFFYVHVPLFWGGNKLSFFLISRLMYNPQAIKPFFLKEEDKLRKRTHSFSC